jgi:hypothetical protein
MVRLEIEVEEQQRRYLAKYKKPLAEEKRLHHSETSLDGLPASLRPHTACHAPHE